MVRAMDESLALQPRDSTFSKLSQSILFLGLTLHSLALTVYLNPTS